MRRQKDMNRLDAGRETSKYDISDDTHNPIQSFVNKLMTAKIKSDGPVDSKMKFSVRETTIRECLCCGKEFKSEGIGNRCCDKCREASVDEVGE